MIDKVVGYDEELAREKVHEWLDEPVELDTDRDEYPEEGPYERY